MQISDEAKKKFEELFAANNCDCLKAMVEKSCCSSSLVFDLVKLEANDKAVSINGVNVLMDDEAKEKAEMISITVNNGELAIKDESSCSCGCGSDCGSGCGC